MGGVAGHMAHLSEDTDLTFNEIVSVLPKSQVPTLKTQLKRLTVKTYF